MKAGATLSQILRRGQLARNNFGQLWTSQCLLPQDTEDLRAANTRCSLHDQCRRVFAPSLLSTGLGVAVSAG